MSWEPPSVQSFCPNQDASCVNSTMFFFSFLANYLSTPVGVSSSDSDSMEPSGRYSRDYYDDYDSEPPIERYGTKIWPTGDDDNGLNAGKAVFPKPDGPPEEYDFIVVGAGSAGCVVANRLSKNKHWKVLLLEAGIEEPLVAQTPALSTITQASNLNWGDSTVKMKSACLSSDGICPAPRGKVMGGSSAIGYTLYVRAAKSDYDDWAAMGNEGWSYDEVLPYFKKSENNLDREVVEANPGYHGTGGYQSVHRFDYKDKNAQIILQALDELGYKMTDESVQSLGSQHYQSTATHGTRQSTNIAFIAPIRHKRKNLVIETEAYATRVVIDPETKIAVGVEYHSTKDNCTKLALARKEVIVSAGTINTPKLLLLSGIGPADELVEQGIEVITESAVGRNLHDHTSSFGFTIAMPNSSKTTPDSNEQVEQDGLQWIENRTGPWSYSGLITVGAFIQTPFEESPDKPDFQIAFLGTNILQRLYLPSVLAYYSDISIGPVMVAPRSRGYVKLNKEDPVWGSPRINPRYYEAYPDLDISVAGSKIEQKLFETKAFKDNGFSMVREPMPGCKQHEFDSDDYWRCVFMQYTVSCNHHVGTAKMGPIYDIEAVVDPRLRVYGVKSLRVVDASIMPVIPRGHTNAPTIMIAEKGSAMIIEDWM